MMTLFPIILGEDDGENKRCGWIASIHMCRKTMRPMLCVGELS